MDEINLLTVIPWFHSFGCLTLITTGVMGACLVYLPKFEEHLFLSAIEVGISFYDIYTFNLMLSMKSLKY